MARSPGLCAAAIVSMAIGIGANTAIFSVVNALLLRRLPVHDPQALVLLGVSLEGKYLGTSLPYPLYRRLRDANTGLSGVLSMATMSPALDAGGPRERVDGRLVSGNYFDVLGVAPHLGRAFTIDDERAGANSVVVLSHGSWTRRFGGDPDVIGRVVHLNDVPMTIVGVAPASFRGFDLLTGPELYVPITLQAEMLGQRSRLEAPGFWWLEIVGRLQPGVTRVQAADALNRQFRTYRADLPEPDGAPDRVEIVDGSRGDPSLAEEYTLPLTVLSGLVAVVLALVCVNVGNLLLARSTTRKMEMSLRLALGAGRLRVMRQLLVEACLLAAAAGAVGLIASHWGVGVLAQLADLPPDVGVGVDVRVLAFSTALTCLTGLVCGVAPAWSAGRISVLDQLRSEPHQYTPVRTIARRTLVAGQIALSLALLTGAGLLARTLFNLRHAPVGVDVSSLALVTVNPALAGYTSDRIPAFHAQVLERVSALPSVESAAWAVVPLLSGDAWGSGLTLDTGEHDDEPGPRRNAVGPGFFRTLGVPVREGREFLPTDVRASEPVAVVNETFARRYFGAGPALGRRLGPGGPRGAARFTVVGVVPDGRSTDLRETPQALWYVPYAQIDGAGELTLHLRARGRPDAALRDARQVIAAIDRRVAVAQGATLRQRLENEVQTERLLASLAGAFALMAVVLAALGLYGTVSYLTSARTREIGVRMTLGASPRAIQRLVLASHAPTIVAGSIVGIAISLVAAAPLSPLLFELEPTDPVTIASAAVIVAIVTTGAALLPARRAARIDPAIAVR
jgi:predicted permease